MQQLAILLACTQSLGRWLRLLNGTMIRDYFSLHTITYTAAPHGSPPLSVLPLQYLTQKQVKFMMVADVLLFLQHFHYYCVCIGLIISIMEFNVMANLKKVLKSTPTTTKYVSFSFHICFSFLVGFGRRSNEVLPVLPCKWKPS